MNMIVAFNIGYYSFQRGILTNVPIVWELENIREFSTLIRKQVEFIYKFSVDNLVPKSSICLYANINTDDWEWEFRIMMKNVREYKSLIDSVNAAQESDTTSDK